MRTITNFQICILTGCFVIVHVLLFYVHGVRMLFDSIRYVEQADFLITHGAFKEGTQLFYAIPVTLIAFCRFLFPGTVLPFLILQILLSASAMVCLYKATVITFKSSWAGVIAVLIFLTWWDNVQWNTTVMTESIFCSVVCFTLYCLARFDGKFAQWFLLVILLMLLICTRPTGFVVVMAVVVFLLYHYQKSLAVNPSLNLVVLTTVLITVFTGAWLMFSQWDFSEQLEKGNVITYADVIEGTDQFSQGLRMDTTGVKFASADRHPLLKLAGFVFFNPWYATKAGAIKIWYLISATRPYYSWKHNLFSITWLVIVYSLFVLGFRRSKNKGLKYAIATIIVMNSLLVAIGTVDWDNRFYIPMMPGIVMLAGGGAFEVVKARFLK